jgi:TolB protein
MDADGHALTPVSAQEVTAISPTWGPAGSLFWAESKNYSPFRLIDLELGATPKRIALPTQGSVYGVAFNKDYSKLALAIAENGGHTSIYTGNPDGSNLKKVSNTAQATHPAFSPSGKLAWLGGGDRTGTQRVYIDGKPVSPSGFTAAAPAFCDTEDGVFLVYAVAVGGERQDLVLSNERGGGMQRLTQNQGSNAYPACSPDGRLLAFFSTRDKVPGMYLMSLKRWKTQKLAEQSGTSLRWAALPPPLPSETP